MNRPVKTFECKLMNANLKAIHMKKNILMIVLTMAVLLSLTACGDSSREDSGNTNPTVDNEIYTAKEKGIDSEGSPDYPGSFLL